MDSSCEMSYSAEQIEQLLRCSVCLDRYRQPKLLPCQHTYCQTPCLEGLVDRLTRMLKCPDCRAEHRVPYQGVSAFPNNLSIVAFLDLAPAQRTTRPNEQTQRQVREANNAEEIPVPTHITPSRSPQPPDAGDDLGIYDDFGNDEGGCPSCGSSRSLTRCAHCDQALCDPCIHYHTDQLKLEIARLVNQVRRGIPKVSDTLTTVEQKCEQTRQHFQGVNADINDNFERYIRSLKSRQRLLLNEGETFIVGELRSLRIFQENLEVEIASMASFCDSTESMLTRSNHNAPTEDLIEIKRQCSEHIDNLRGHEQGEVRLPSTRRISFQTEPQLLSNAITNFGEIHIGSSTSQSVGDSSLQTNDGRPATDTTGRPNTSSTQLMPSRDTVRIVAPETNDTETVLMPDDGGPSGSVDSTPRSRSLIMAPSESRSLPAAVSWRDIVRANTAGDEALLEARRVRNRQRRYHHLSDTRMLGILSESNAQRRRSAHLTDGQLHPSSPRLRVRQEEHSPSPRLGRATVCIREESSSSPSRSDSSTNGNGSSVPSASVRPIPRSPVRFDISSHPDESSEDSDSAITTFSRVSGGASVIVQASENNYQLKGRAIIRFGERGNGQCQFTWPRGVAVSPIDDTIVVADSSNHRVVLFDSAGRFIKTFGSYGSGEGEFDCLAGVAVNSFGEIIVSDRYNHRIQVFDRHGSLKTIFGEEGSHEGELNYPWGVAADNMGYIYVCDKENHRVQAFQSSGVFVRKFGRLGQNLSQLENPHYLAVSPDNKIYVCDTSNHRIQVFSIYGDFLFSFGSEGSGRGQLKHPKGITVDHEGFVIVSDSANNRVQVFRGDGRYFACFGSYGSDNGQFKGLEGIAIMSNGNIVVSDRENHRIQIF